jgi:hypothetical protein
MIILVSRSNIGNVLSVVMYQVMGTHGGMKVRAGCKWSVSCSGRLIPGRRTLVTYSARGWVGPSAGLESVGRKKVSRTWNQIPVLCP